MVWFNSMRRGRTNIEDITKALITSGYTSLDRQAKALGLHRSTVWTITKNRHKLGRLSRKTIERISQIRTLHRQSVVLFDNICLNDLGSGPIKVLADQMIG